MTKIVKISDDWLVEDMNMLMDKMEEQCIEGVVVRDSELEVYDGDLEKITVEGEEVLEDRFTGDSLYVE